MDSHLRTEEDLKIKVVLPYLNSLGIADDEIQFETRVKIRLGKKEYVLYNELKKESVSGRIDILCKKEEKNLFLIEVKSEQVKITKDDIAQGLSYASLLRPIPPFLLVTNGRETKVVDVLSTEELNGTNIGEQSPFWKNGCNLSASEDLELRYNAVKKFIGYSTENLRSFSQSQIEERMLPLKGDKLCLNKKYVPELFLKNDDLIVNFEAFIKSESKCFALIGESGVGKTNQMCGLVESFIENNLCFFYGCAFMNESIFNSIREDFNWALSQYLETPELFRRIDELAIAANCRAIFFFDAIDESPILKFNRQLDEFVRLISRFSNIKLCISCKTSMWEDYLQISDSPSYVKEHLFEVKERKVEDSMHSSMSMYEQKYQDNLPGYVLSRFSDAELKILVDKYRDYFQFKGSLSDDLKSECKLGFMLRVLAETYRNESLPETVNNISLLSNYLDKKLVKFEDENLAKRYLEKIGQALIEKKENEKDYRYSLYISESELREYLGLQIDVEISQELFEHDILVRAYSKDQECIIGFYNDKIRDFVVSIISYRVHTLSQPEFKNALHIFLKSKIGRSALSWYYTVATDSHKEVFMSEKKARFLVFINSYNAIIDEYFPGIRESFEPHTKSYAGVVVSFNRERRYRGWGFFQLTDDEMDTVQFFRAENKKEYYKGFFERKVSPIYYDVRGLFPEEPELLAKEYIKKQLSEILWKGPMNESDNPGLKLEKIHNIVYKFYKQLKLTSARKRSMFLTPHDFFPINCAELLNRIDRFLFTNHIRQKLVLERKYTSEQIVLNLVEDALQSKVEISEHDVCREFKPLLYVRELIKEYNKNDSVIPKPLLPSPDITNEKELLKRYESLYPEMKGIAKEMIIQYSDLALKKYIIAFFKYALDEYKVLVENCFGNFRDKINLYSMLPVELSFQIDTHPKYLPLIHYWYIKSSTCKNVIYGEVNPSQTKLPDISPECTIYGTSLEHFFYSSNNFRLSRSLKDISLINGMLVLRSWVLSKIEDEKQEIIDLTFPKTALDMR